MVPILLSVLGCKQECFTRPSVELLDTAHYLEDTYYLYPRTTGIQEKQTFFELYKGEPDMDYCNNANMKAVAIVAHDHEKYVSEVIFQPKNANLLHVSFTSDGSLGYSDTSNVKFNQ